MNSQRQLVSVAALGLFTLLAFGSEVPEDTGAPTAELAPSPSSEVGGDVSDQPAGDAPAVGKVQCTPWSGTGAPAASIEALFDAKTLQSMGRKLDFNVECYDVEEYDGNQELDCNFWNDEWAFDIDIYEFRSTQDAKWQVEDPWVGEAYRRDGKWVLEVSAENGACAKAFMDAMVPKNERLKNFDEKRIKAGIKSAGWSLGEYGCSMEKYDGDISHSCPFVQGKKLEGTLYLSYEIESGQNIDEERELDSGSYYLRQAYGYASTEVEDSASAEAMIKALLR